MIGPFYPVKTHTFTLVASTSQEAAVPWEEGEVVEIYNAASADAFFKWGTTSAVTADATAIVIPKGQVRQYKRRSPDTFIALFSTGTGPVYVTPGNKG